MTVSRVCPYTILARKPEWTILTQTATMVISYHCLETDINDFSEIIDFTLNIDGGQIRYYNPCPECM